MQNRQTGVSFGAFGHRWSNRILILATSGILFLTLYPFRFAFHTGMSGGASPFLLGKFLEPTDFLHSFLNVLLFVPFGFGLAEKLRERGKSRTFTLALALSAGALFSYSIELLQFYIPQRDSCWEDVLTNSLGSLAGCVLYELLGRFALRCLSSFEDFLRALLTPWRTVALLLIYFTVWFAAASRLQRKTRLINWRTDALLVVGNDASGKSPWKGTVNAVQLWDLALREEVAKQISVGEAADTGNPGLLVDYDFSAGPPFRNQKQISSELAWVPGAPAVSGTGMLVLDGAAWLSTGVAVPDLIANLQKTNQFAIHVRCTPAQGAEGDGRIISVSQLSGFPNLALRQEGTTLVFWFRNPLSANHSILAWYFPGVFTPGRTRDILYSYDGSNLSLFLDGNKQPFTYRLGPGTGLTKLVRTVKSAELEGYNCIFYILVFGCAGALQGLAARNLAPLNYSARLWLGFGFVVPAIILEWVLVSTSGRSFAPDYLGLSVLLAIIGFLWINTDRQTAPTRRHLSTDGLAAPVTRQSP